MKKYYLLLLLIQFSFGDTTYTEERHSRMIKTLAPDTLTEKIILNAKYRGGYFSFLNQEFISLKVPKSNSRLLLNYIDSIGQILNKQQSLTDLTQDWFTIKSSISAKTKLMDEYFKALSLAGRNQVLEVHRAISNLQTEIDQEKASQNQLSERIQLVHIDIYYKLPQPTPPPNQGNTLFPWINRLDITSLQKDFSHEP